MTVASCVVSLTGTHTSLVSTCRLEYKNIAKIKIVSRSEQWHQEIFSLFLMTLFIMFWPPFLLLKMTFSSLCSRRQCYKWPIFRPYAPCGRTSRYPWWFQKESLWSRCARLSQFLEARAGVLLRSWVSGPPPGLDLAGQAFQAAWAAHTHQTVPCGIPGPRALPAGGITHWMSSAWALALHVDMGCHRCHRPESKGGCTSHAPLGDSSNRQKEFRWFS